MVSRRPAAVASLSALAALALLSALVASPTPAVAYNEDRPIYKWSPVWFSRYFRTVGAAVKREAQDAQRALEEQVALEAEGLQEAPAECVADGRRCGMWGVSLPCCQPHSRCLMDHCVTLADQYIYLPED